MLSDLLCPISATIAEALRCIDKNKRGIICFHSSDYEVTAIMTDGDIRRALLNGAVLDSDVKYYANFDFFWMQHGLSHEEYTSKLSDKLQHIIILNEQRRLVSIISFRDEAVIPVSSINLVGNELNYVTQCIKSNWISSQGNFVQKFEEIFATFHNMPYALTTSSGTTALHLALAGLGIGSGDEIIVPVSTFGATANAVIHTGGIPVFVDIEKDTWCIDPALIEEAITPATKAIIPVHLYGNPANIDAIKIIARKHDLFIIEDNAEALGATFSDGSLTGTKSDVSCFSFFSNKVITTGEGGMVLTNDISLHRKMQQLRDHGISFERKYWHDYPGFNYRITNIQAAIGLAQMERINDFLQIRDCIATKYTEHLKFLPGIELQVVKPCFTAINWLFTLALTKEFPINRDNLIEHLKSHGIDSRPFFPALFHQPAYKHYLRNMDFPVGLYMEKYGISLPTSNLMKLIEVDKVCNVIIDVYKNYNRHNNY